MVTRCPSCKLMFDASGEDAPPTRKEEKEDLYRAQVTVELVRAGRIDTHARGFVEFKAWLCELATQNVAWAAEALRDLVETRRAS